MILIKKTLRKYTTTIHCDERFVIIKVYLFINVYLQYSGTVNRYASYKDLLADIWSWRDHCNKCECIIGGDFNANFDDNDNIASCLKYFITDCSLTLCDDLFPLHKRNTYVNMSLNHSRCIDYYTSFRCQ